MRKRLAMLLTLAMAFGLAACGSDTASTDTASTEAAGDAAETAEAAEPVAGGTFRTVEAAPYASLDVHKDYYSWHTQFYGI